MAWIYLLTAGLLEIGFTTAMRFSEGFTRLWPTLAFVALGALSFYCLGRAIATIPLGTAYAVWTGIGAAGTAVLGILYFQEPLTFWRVFFIVTLIASIVGLKLVAGD